MNPGAVVAWYVNDRKLGGGMVYPRDRSGWKPLLGKETLPAFSVSAGPAPSSSAVTETLRKERQNAELLQRLRQEEATKQVDTPKARVDRVDEVIEAVKADVSDEEGIASLRKDNRPIDLSLTDKAKLKKAGVSDRVIRVMQDPSAK